jgi:hypothetical protein
MRLPIRELAEIQIGYQVRGALDIVPAGTHRIIQAKDIDHEMGYSLRTAELSCVTPKRNVDSYLVREGDIIFLSRGRRRSATLVENLSEDLPTIAFYYFFILRLKSGVVPSFLVWALNNASSQEYLERTSTGTGMPFVTKHAFSDLKVAIPSREKQEAIGRISRLSYEERSLLRILGAKRLESLQSVCQEICEDA